MMGGRKGGNEGQDEKLKGLLLDEKMFAGETRHPAVVSRLIK